MALTQHPRKREDFLPSPPIGLRGRILNTIEKKERQALIIKMCVLGGVFAVSAFTAIYASSAAFAEAANTGFLTLFSLLFTDFGATMANFSDFAFSIAESLPAFSAALALGGVLFTVWSTVKFAKDAALVRSGMFHKA